MIIIQVVARSSFYSQLGRIILKNTKFDEGHFKLKELNGFKFLVNVRIIKFNAPMPWQTSSL